MKLFIGLLIVVVVIVLGLGAYVSHFFINAALFRDSTWFKQKGHKMMNPDNFVKTKTEFDKIEERQINEGKQHWQTKMTEEITLTSKGDQLVAKVFENNPESTQWVIGVHGYRSNGERDMAYMTKKLNECGYNVLIPDLRAHGKSGGNVIGMGWLDRLDVELWVEWLIETHPDCAIVLFGGSMGAATVMMASGDSLPPQVKGIVSDCGYTSVRAQFEEMLTGAIKLPSFPIMTFANLFAKAKVGYSLNEASSVKQLEKNTLPVLFIHGTEDKFVPYAMMEVNKAATQGYVETLTIPKAPHLSSWIYDETLYLETLTRFLNHTFNEETKNGYEKQ